MIYLFCWIYIYLVEIVLWNYKQLRAQVISKDTPANSLHVFLKSKFSWVAASQNDNNIYAKIWIDFSHILSNLSARTIKHLVPTLIQWNDFPVKDCNSLSFLKYTKPKWNVLLILKDSN